MEEGLTTILPTYNEEANIRYVVSDVIFYMRKYINNFEVIIINDGSSDATLRILNEIKILYPEIEIVSHERNKGYGYAIKTGIRLAQKEWIFIMDSDNQYRVNGFDAFWNNRQYYDFILGYRLVRRDNIYRQWLGKIGTYIANLFLNEPTKDLNCGFKLFRRRDLKNITLISTGGCIHFEILFYLMKYKNKFFQLPVKHYRRNGGKATGGSLKVIFKNIWEGIKIVFHKKAEVL